MWLSWVYVSTWVGGDGERGGDGGGRGNGGGCWIVSWTLRFAFSSINHRMFASCCCLETSKSASIFFVIIPFVLEFPILLMSWLVWSTQMNCDCLSLLVPFCNRRKFFLSPTVGAKCSYWVLTELPSPPLPSVISDLQGWSEGRYLQKRL